MGSKKKPDRKPKNDKPKRVYELPKRRRIHSDLATLEQMIRENVRPSRNDLAAVLDGGDLKVGVWLVPDAVRKAIQDELLRKDYQGIGGVPVKNYRNMRFNPLYDFEAVERECDERGEKVRVGQLTEAVVKANPIGSDQLKRLRRRRKAAKHASSANNQAKSSP